ncbi:MAG: hypothetical protein KAW17_01795 [Candidatus Eisenbacteria sp.]|nr:hypothetical protein [Candidatus Eisenbacteria bacterium]
MKKSLLTAMLLALIVSAASGSTAGRGETRKVVDFYIPTEQDMSDLGAMADIVTLLTVTMVLYDNGDVGYVLLDGATIDLPWLKVPVPVADIAEWSAGVLLTRHGSLWVLQPSGDDRTWKMLTLKSAQ